MKACFIVNPRSGRALRALPAVRAFAAARGAEVRLTERSRHASELAREAIAAGCELVVAVGGDGTMNEIASQLVGTGATLGLVPCGSGDGLGRHLRIHGSTTRALHILETGSPRVIDTGLADGHPFFTESGLGFEAEISQRFNRLTRRGFARYISTSARALRQWHPREYTIVHGATRHRLRAFTLAVANSDQYGNDARIAPRARIDDGLLNLCAIPPVTVWNALPLFFRLFHGSLADSGTGLHLAGERFTVECDANDLLHTDGEVHAVGKTVEFVIRPASLRVMCPAV